MHKLHKLKIKMGLTEKLMKKKERMEETIRNQSEDFNSLIRVYLQAAMASSLGIVDFRLLPDLKLFKQKLRIPTEGRLGVAEKKYIRKLMLAEYGIEELFFNEIDSSVKRCCKKQNDMQNYFYLFQGFSQDLFMAVAGEMQMALRLPAFLRSWIKKMTKDTIHNLLTTNDFKASDVRQAAVNVRAYKEKLHFSEDWMLQYTFPVLMIAKGAKVKK